MVRDCGLHLISKLRRDAALYVPPETPYQGRGRPAIYGERVNPKEIDEKYRVSTQTQGNITTEVYQSEHPGYGVLDLKARYRGQKYLQETLKILPQKPEAIVIDDIAERLGALGAIHYTSPQIRPG